jgi:hypothetical protein
MIVDVGAHFLETHKVRASYLPEPLESRLLSTHI